MILRRFVYVVLCCSLAGCASPEKKKAEEAKMKLQQTAIDDMSGDVDFQAFMGQLRQAVATHDLQMLASLMTTDFGYHMNPDAEGAGVFQYWDQMMIWPEVQKVLNQPFAPAGEYMVAPADFVTDPNFHGYHAGMRVVDGAWKFAYFVSN